MPLLSVKDLTIYFNTDEGQITAVEDVSFDVRRGEILGIVGESGSGKSVSTKSLMMLNGRNSQISPESRLILKTDDGPVDIASLSHVKDLRLVRGHSISMIFQEPMASFAPAVKIGKQMVEQLLIHTDLDKTAAKARSIEILSRVGIPDPELRFNQFSFELSGGMRQRAMIAMALSTRPKLLIADEPTTALDVTIQAQVLALIKDLVAEFDMSVILITHDLGVIAQTADRVAVMYLGRIVEQGTTRDVITSPQHPYTQGLINSRPSLDHFEDPLTPLSGDLPSPLERPQGCVFHTRCAHAIKGLCDTQKPPVIGVAGQDPTDEDAHNTSCHLLSPSASEQVLVS